MALGTMACPPQVNLTVCSFSEAWITRTEDLPAGVVSSSFSTCSRRPDLGPMPATV